MSKKAFTHNDDCQDKLNRLNMTKSLPFLTLIVQFPCHSLLTPMGTSAKKQKFETLYLAPSIKTPFDFLLREKTDSEKPSFGGMFLVSF